jgi:exosortase
MATKALSTVTGRNENTPLGWLLSNPLLAAGAVALIIPTMLLVARLSWSTEQGAHGPIVMATGLWLYWREWQVARPYFKPAPGLHVALVFIPLLILYFIARVSKIIELEGYLMYGVLVAVLFSMAGVRAMRIMWFPILYMIITNPLKIALSDWAVSFLYWMGYPIASAGVTIQIGQYQLLVADACSGLNSLISLSAISLFYVYLRHHANVRYALLLFIAVLPVAIFANLIRILFLVLLTYYGGESAAQGFLHDFAGMTTFMTALISIFAIDHFIGLLLPGIKRGQRRASVAS